MASQRRTPGWAILLAGLILAWPAAWNGYPLVFADSGTYLGQAIDRYLGWDRPPHYSLFLHTLHWQVSLWPIPVVQGLLAAHLMAVVLRVLGRPGSGVLLGTCATLAVATGLPWFTAQVMPDVFTGMVVLCLWLLGFRMDRLGRVERVYLTLLAAGAVAVHLAHLPLALGLAALGAVMVAAARGRQAALSAGARMAAPAALALVALMGANLLGHGRLSVSPFGSVFLAARLLEDGPALRTLDHRCPTEGWAACAIRQRLPMPANDFLWRPDGPLRADLGGGKAWAAEASAIVGATLRREPGAVARNAAVHTLRQFGLFHTGDGLEPWRGEPGPEPLIAAHFPHELRAYQASLQSSGALMRDAAALAPLHAGLAWAGLVALAWLGWQSRRHPPRLALAVMVLAAGLGNAAITGALSGPHARYQGRIAWLFVLAPVAIALSARRVRQADTGWSRTGPVPAASPITPSRAAGAAARRGLPPVSHATPSMQAASAQGEDMSGLLDVAAEARQISGPHGEVARMVPFTRLLAARHDAAARFRAARPFAHVVLDELFDERVLDRLAAHDAAAARRPDVGSLGDPPSYPDAFIRQLGSEPVLDWLREVTGIEDLVAAPDLHGSSLDPDLHADGLRHPSLPLVRRLVLVIHVARGGEPDGGEPDGGGGLERLGADGAAQDAIIAPRFNRAVLFEAGAAAGPTHAAALRRPDGTGCRAVSIAYWSPDPTARPDLAAGRRARRAQAGAQGGPPSGTDGLSLARSLVEPLARHLRAVLGRST